MTSHCLVIANSSDIALIRQVVGGSLLNTSLSLNNET